MMAVDDQAGSPPPTFEELVPPPTLKQTLLRQVAATIAVGIAAVVGVAVDGVSAVDATRVVVVFVGVIAASWLLSQRWMEPAPWFAAGGTFWLGALGLPTAWDSGKLVCCVLGTILLALGVVRAMPKAWRAVALTAALLFHFGAILAATTWPETYDSPPPVITNQVATRVYLPYYRFFYLGNAYHFYSPNPGAASHLFILVEGVTDDDAEPDAKTGAVPRDASGQPMKRKRSEWIDIPKRQTHFRDPLGLSYYRRLSLTELVSYATPGAPAAQSWERNLAIVNRRNNELNLNGLAVPGAMRQFDTDLSQYRVPQQNIRRSLHPSYARHIALEFSGPRKLPDGRVVQFTVTGMKMFQVQHNIITQQQFLGLKLTPEQQRVERGFRMLESEPMNPNHRTLYVPSYLGEYDRDGVLLNPDDPLLYWHVPVLPDPRDPSKTLDYLSLYAGFDFPWNTQE